MSTSKPNARAQNGKLVLVVVLVLRSKGPYCCKGDCTRWFICGAARGCVVAGGEKASRCLKSLPSGDSCRQELGLYGSKILVGIAKSETGNTS